MKNKNLLRKSSMIQMIPMTSWLGQQLTVTKHFTVTANYYTVQKFALLSSKKTSLRPSKSHGNVTPGSFKVVEKP